ncbi:hypothetical protein [Chamaesiphon minutus]|uniref:Uncharacterized protein n=1 Tax=Chamaesiphon minutus (strain ATCC 27169 / PCC 6605) TaxID=1173020 RepID=K9UIJ9_CHAP6|nr:hypothetical protein [Chamaesiphon minutus]AFY94635.1 hypothetical protein Cha6605_3654 [Chamaesiphon minutus PCC 6605]
MDYQPGQQLSLIAEDFGCEPEVGDWHGDTRSVPLRERSIEEVRAYFVRSVGGKPDLNVALHDGGQTKNSLASIDVEGNGGQPQTRIVSMEGNGGQFKNRWIPEVGDDGTWIETQHRKTGDFKYLRWREFATGIKRSHYQGKA